MTIIWVRKIETTDQGAISFDKALLDVHADRAFLLSNAGFKMRLQPDEVACPLIEDLVGKARPKQPLLSEGEENVPGPKREEHVGVEHHHERECQVFCVT